MTVECDENYACGYCEDFIVNAYIYDKVVDDQIKRSETRLSGK